MVHTILRPAVTDFFDFAMQDRKIELKMEELKVRELGSLPIDFLGTQKR